MSTKCRTTRGRLLPIIVMLSMLGCIGAQAQRFEYTYGGVCNDMGHGGVQQVSSGGYVAAGETWSVNTGCTTQDAYVVRTNNDGTLEWSRTYRIGIFAVANDIQEVKNAVGTHDGFIVVGTTRDPAGCGFVNQDMLLLRLDACGNVTWSLSVDDGLGGYDAGNDVVVATNGDFIAVGTTSAGSNGFMVRVSPAGALLWARQYNAGGTDYFNAVDEASNGDIIAAGGTNSTPSGTFDAWIVRVSNAGGFVAVPHNAVKYGGTASNDDLRSVQKLTQGTKAGDIVAVGKSDYGHPGSPEVLLVETSLNPCVGQVARLYGDNGNQPDEGYCVREIRPYTGTGASTIVVTGYLTPPAAVGFGLQDAFLKKFTTGTLAQILGSSGAIYGSAFADWGWSVSQVPKAATCSTEGFVVAGWGKASPKQLYMIKTNTALSSGCEVLHNATSTTPSFGSVCQLPVVSIIGASCVPVVETTCPTWATMNCYTADGISACAIPDCPDCAGAKRVGARQEHILDINEMMFPYPSPVLAGESFTLEYTMPADGPVEISVGAINGTVVYQRQSQAATGPNRTSIATAGWPSGAYMVRVTAGTHSYTRGVTVLGR